MLEIIKANITKHGHHIYLVSGGPLPRFAYTIGLSQSIGTELILAGASFYMAEDVMRIINEFAATLRRATDWRQCSLEIDNLGLFFLRKTDASWSKALMLGALDFYKKSEIEGLQIVPDQAHWTLDTPNFTEPYNPREEPVWQWLHKPWSYRVAPKSTAVTNLDALRGGRITEAARWEEEQWELFSGSGPDTVQEEIRIVPLGTLLAIDQSLNAVTELDVGHALWRDPAELEWHPWG
jgi:hypothetical protein